MNKEIYIEDSKKWVSEFVIKNNICPFASGPFRNGKIDWKVLDEAPKFDGILEMEIKHFIEDDWNNISSKFLIIPFLDNFNDYVEVYYLMDYLTEKNGLEKFVQFVSFHPESRYGDVEPNDPVNFANRSPYPMIQILKKPEVESLNLSEEDKMEILENNENFLISEGFEKLTKNLNGFRHKN